VDVGVVSGAEVGVVAGGAVSATTSPGPVVEGTECTRPSGSITVDVSDRPAQARVDPETGEVVREGG